MVGKISRALERAQALVAVRREGELVKIAFWPIALRYVRDGQFAVWDFRGVHPAGWPLNDQRKSSNMKHSRYVQWSAPTVLEE